MSQYSELIELILEFRDQRNWSQFHTLKNLSAALSIESGELQELLLWLGENEVEAKLSDNDFKVSLEDECADIFNYLVLISDRAGFDILDVAKRKIEKNKLKYPVEKSYGVATKYNKFE